MSAREDKRAVLPWRPVDVRIVGRDRLAKEARPADPRGLEPRARDPRPSEGTRRVRRRQESKPEAAPAAQVELPFARRKGLEAVRQEAYAAGEAAGRAAGHAAGLAEAEGKVAQAQDSLTRALQAELSAADQRAQSELERAGELFCQLALEIGARLAGEAIAAGAYAPGQLLASILAETEGQTVTLVRLSAADDELLTGEDTEAPWSVDPSLGAGEFVIETAGGRLVATLEARLRNLREALSNAEGAS